MWACSGYIVIETDVCIVDVVDEGSKRKKKEE